MNEILLGTVIFTGLVMALSFVVLGARKVVWGRGRANFTLNGEKTFDSPLGIKVLDVLTREGINLPTSCGGAGTCGLCRVQISGTDDEALPTERAKLTDQDVKDGYRLACQMVVRGDMDVTVPPEMLGTETWNCTVASARTLSPLIKEIVLDLPQDKETDIPVGSYVLVNVPSYKLAFEDIVIEPQHDDTWKRLGLRKLKAQAHQGVSRAYSVVLRPDDKEHLTLNIRLALPPAANPDAPPGQVSSYLFSLKDGDTLEVMGPYGHFFVQDTDREIIFIGGGVGMAPLYTHIFDQLEAKNTSRKVSYWFGARGKEDLYYVEDMNGLSKKHTNFAWYPVLSEPNEKDEWQGLTGFVHEAVFENYLKTHDNPANCEYYLCGPPLMIKAVRVMLDKLGVPSDNVLSDDFGI